MRHLDYDPEDEKFDEGDEDMENFNDEDEEIYKAMKQEELELKHVEIAFMDRSFNDRLIFKATKMLERGFFWKFYSLDTKLKLIEKVYKKIKKIAES